MVRTNTYHKCSSVIDLVEVTKQIKHPIIWFTHFACTQAFMISLKSLTFENSTDFILAGAADSVVFNSVSFPRKIELICY